MKKILIILPAVILVVGFGIHKSLAGPSYPSTLSVSGYGNYRSELIQPLGYNWTASFSWDSTQSSNLSADLMIINQDGTVKDNHLVGPTTEGGSFTMSESGNSPVYFAVNAGNWHLSVE